MSGWIDIPPKPTLILDSEDGAARCLNCYTRTHITARECHADELGSGGCGIKFTQITSAWYSPEVCAGWRDDLDYVEVQWV